MGVEFNNCFCPGPSPVTHPQAVAAPVKGRDGAPEIRDSRLTPGSHKPLSLSDEEWGAISNRRPGGLAGEPAHSARAPKRAREDGRPEWRTLPPVSEEIHDRKPGPRLAHPAKRPRACAGQSHPFVGVGKRTGNRNSLRARTGRGIPPDSPQSRRVPWPWPGRSPGRAERARSEAGTDGRMRHVRPAHETWRSGL